MWYHIEMSFVGNSMILLEHLAKIYSSCCKYVSICSWQTYFMLWSKQKVKLSVCIPWRHMEEC